MNYHLIACAALACLMAAPVLAAPPVEPAAPPGQPLWEIGLAGGDSILSVITELVVGMVASALAYPFMAGLNMIGIRRAADQPISFNEVFAHFGRTVPILLRRSWNRPPVRRCSTPGAHPIESAEPPATAR